ncbi:MAG: alpha/beta hydrolase [Lachnospiraceae bacterium]|nr:alpha/beta hydrolase [Lachnospiraceae bacterium]
MNNIYTIWEDGEYQYAGAFGFTPNIHAYLHEDENTRPAMIVVPGGGYRVVSPTEGEIVAKKFYEAGYQSFVLTYTTNLIGIAPLKLQPLHDLSRAVRFVRANKEKFGVSEDLYLCGFSAGAHLAGSLAVHWQDTEDTNAKYHPFANRPTGVILSYPVITAGKQAHRDSFVALCGENATQEELSYFSLEKQVTDQTPPMFLWQTVSDELVPVENSMLMMKALKDAGISFEYHLFPKGAHGLSLSDEVWETGDLGDPYTMEQTMNIIYAVKSGALPLPQEAKKQLLDAFAYMDPENYDPDSPRPASGVAAREVAVWPDLAISWMKSQNN